jgi:integration host factor subunit beta
MIRSDLIRKLAADNPHLPLKTVEAAVLTIFAEITAALARGERVSMRGFGSFTRKTYRPRLRRNPKTGAMFSAASAKAPRYKASKVLLNQINGQSSE